MRPADSKVEFGAVLYAAESYSLARLVDLESRLAEHLRSGVGAMTEGGNAIDVGTEKFQALTGFGP